MEKAIETDNASMIERIYDREVYEKLYKSLRGKLFSEYE